MTTCTVTAGNTYRTPEGLFRAGDTVVLTSEAARKGKAEGVLHFEEPPKLKPKIEVKEGV